MYINIFNNYNIKNVTKSIKNLIIYSDIFKNVTFHFVNILYGNNFKKM